MRVNGVDNLNGASSSGRAPPLQNVVHPDSSDSEYLNVSTDDEPEELAPVEYDTIVHYRKYRLNSLLNSSRGWANIPATKQVH